MTMAIIDITKNNSMMGGIEQGLPVQCDIDTLKAISKTNGVADLITLSESTEVSCRTCIMTGREEVILDFWKDFKVCILSAVLGKISVIRVCKSIPYFDSLRELNNENLNTLLDDLEGKILESVEVLDIVNVLKENRPTLLRIEGELMKEFKVRGRKRMSYDEFREYANTEEFSKLRKYSLKSLTVSYEPQDELDEFLYVGVPNMGSYAEMLDFCGSLGAQVTPIVMLNEELIEAVEKLPVNSDLVKNIHRLVYTNMSEVLGSNIDAVLEYVKILEAYRYVSEIIG